jgi:uncharacterized protein (DUF2336 family)
MIVQRFLAWAPTAPAAQRAAGAGALARAYLYSGLDLSDRQAAEAALTMLLDDPCVDVRRNIAEALAPSFFAPRHIILGLAHDSPEAAVPVLMLSPVLHDSELIELLPIRGQEEQAAIAARGGLSAGVAAAIAEIASPMACAVLARNPHADMTPGAYARLTDRCGGDASIRDALLDRSDLPISERQKLMMKLADSLGEAAVSKFSLGEERVRRMTQDACERATLQLAGDLRSSIGPLVAHLRESGQLTTGLVLRALLGGEMDFVEAAFAELTGVASDRVQALLHDPARTGFRALYHDAGLPLSTYGAFREAFEAWAELREIGVTGAEARKHVAERALALAETGELGGAAELLKRMAVDAAREQAMDGLKISGRKSLAA